MPSTMITETDVDGFRHKLAEWGGSLSEGEQAVLQMVLVRAFPGGAGGDDDVSGFAAISPRDPASGLPTGKRMHKPFVISPAMGSSFGVLIGLDRPTIPFQEQP